MKRGTAIGDAIWLALRKVNKTEDVKKLVIIGDGDNNAGFIQPMTMIKLANQKKVAIYTIGVGTKGLVPYGKDEKGKTQMIDNTFSDLDFKKISELTGGEYYWAKDSQALTEILNVIFSK